MTVRKLGEMAQVMGEGGEVIEEFASSGCVYNDLGCCQGCPTCRLHHSNRHQSEYTDATENVAEMQLWDEMFRNVDSAKTALGNMQDDIDNPEWVQSDIEAFLDAMQGKMAAEISYLLMTGAMPLLSV